jgi:hypothetical protein
MYRSTQEREVTSAFSVTNKSSLMFQGDMRQALNNLQSTKEGFGLVNSENVFKVILRLIVLVTNLNVGKCSQIQLRT